MRSSALFWLFVAGLCVVMPVAGLAIIAYDLLDEGGAL